MLKERSKMNEYIEFLKRKVQLTSSAGLRAADLHPSLFPHQRDIVSWALQRGKALIAAKFGLGKSRVQIELLRQVHAQTGHKVLVICPLGVKHQFIHEDGPAMDVHFAYIGNDAQGLSADTPYLITNYERVRDGQITEAFLQSEVAGVCLDEGCFAAGTLLDTPEGQRKIETLQPGDSVYSAAGVDKVISTTTRIVERLVIVHVDGHAVVSSDNHPYLTAHGWKRADQLKEEDELVTQDEAMQILQCGIQAQATDESVLFQNLFNEMDRSAKTKAAELSNMRMVRQRVCRQMESEITQSFLQPVMLQLMANGTAGNQSALAFAGSSCPTRCQEERMVCCQFGKSASGEKETCFTGRKSDRRNTQKGVGHDASKGNSSCSARWQWARFDRITENAIDSTGGRLGIGTYSFPRPAQNRLSNALQTRLGESSSQMTNL